MTIFLPILVRLANVYNSVEPGMAENNNVLEEGGNVHHVTKLRLLFNRLIQETIKMDLTVDDLVDIYIRKKYNDIQYSQVKFTQNHVWCANTVIVSAKPCGRWKWVLGAVLVVVFSVLLYSQSHLFVKQKNDFISSKCIIRNNYFVMEATRPRTPCERVCKGVDGPAELCANISQEEFERWAYISRPLVVRGGAAHWPALEAFSVAFFRSVYDSIEGAYESVSYDCQFLPFRTEFVDLRAALNMHPHRAARLPGTHPWYFGW